MTPYGNFSFVVTLNVVTEGPTLGIHSNKAANLPNQSEKKNGKDGYYLCNKQGCELLLGLPLK